ncbi:MAG: YIP1 family protein [Bdellovibrionia bacterium]
MIDCPHCGFNFQDAEAAGDAPLTCPSCGKSQRTRPPKLESGLALIQNYFSQLWCILTHPTKFFRELPASNDIARPLAFALVTHWLGAAFGYLWHLAIGGSLHGYLRDILMRAGDSIQIDTPGRSEQLAQLRDHLMGWFLSAGSIVTDPFFTLISILYTSFFVYIGARILVPPKVTVNYPSAVRIVCYGLSPAILAAIPAFGSFAASVYTLVVTIIGAREVYRIGTTRATIVALFPKLLFFGILFFGFIFFAFSIIQLFMSFF